MNSYPALILADTTFTLPFAVIVLRPFFLSIPRELEAAAKIDGCNQFDAFWRVILPLVRPGLITVAVFAFLMGWGEFLFAMSLTTNETVQPATAALNKFIGQYGHAVEQPDGRGDHHRAADHRRVCPPAALYRKRVDGGVGERVGAKESGGHWGLIRGCLPDNREATI